MKGIVLALLGGLAMAVSAILDAHAGGWGVPVWLFLGTGAAGEACLIAGWVIGG